MANKKRILILLFILLSFINNNYNLYSSSKVKKSIEEKIKETLSLENLKYWHGLIPDRKYVKEGKYSGLWKDHYHTTKITTSMIPHDWSDYDAISFWLYSKKANKAEIEVVIDSDNPKTELKDRFRQTIFINWKGWKKIKFKFSDFRVDRSPAGWQKIDGIRFAAAGYSKVPKKDTVLYFDDFKLIKEPVDIDILARNKFFDKNNNYINKITLSLFNRHKKSLKINLKINRNKLRKFRFVKISSRSFTLKGKSQKKIDILFKINKKDYKSLKRFYNEKVLLQAYNNNTLEGSIELKLYSPLYKNKRIRHIFLTQSEIEKAKEKYKKFKWAKETIAAFVRTAKEYSHFPIPKRGGGFYHGGPTAKYYPITLKHENFSRASRYYAIAFAITGKKEYLNKAKKILLSYSRIFPSFPVEDKYGNIGREAWLGGGRWSPQILTDCKMLIFHAYAYDIIKEYLTEKEREDIEKNIFRLEADLLMRNNEGRHNHQIWYDMTLGIMGYMLNDAEYLDFALNAEESGIFTRILPTSFTKEYWYYERSIGYHYYVLYGLTWFLEAAFHSGDNFYSMKEIKSIYKAPIEMLTRDFKFPIINDGRPIEPLLIERAWPYIMAYPRIKDEEFLYIISRVTKEKNIETLLYYPIKDLNKKVNIKLSSVLLPDTQWALLRADNYKSKGNDFYVWFNYTPNVATHCHPDRLSIIVYALNDYILPDAGSGKYRSKYHKYWFKSTIAHNTVCVDMKNQKTYKQVIPPPELKYYYISPELKAVKALSSEVYKGVDFYRTVLMVDDDYILDYVKLISKKKHTYDLAYHIKGKPEYLTFKPIPRRNFYIGYNKNYELIENFAVKKLKGKDVKVLYKNKGGNILLYNLGEKEKELKIITGKGAISDYHENVSKVRVPLIILRKESKNAEFSTIIAPDKNKIKIENFQEIYNNNIKIYQVNRKNKIKDIVLLNNRNSFSGNKEFATDGSFLYVKFVNNNINYIASENVKKIRIKNYIISLNRNGSFYIKVKAKGLFIENKGNSGIKLYIPMKLFNKKGVKNITLRKKEKKFINF